MALFRLTLKNIRARWIRYALTGLAVVLGVGFVVGTFIITDGLRSTFDDLAADIAGDIDLLVRSDQEFGGDAIAAILDPGIADELAEIDGVTTVEGGVFGPGVKVVDAGGESVGEGFTAGFSFGPASSTFLVTDGAFAGREPTGPDEFAINTTAAEDADLVIGEIYSVSAVGGVRDMTLVGVFNWADPEDDQTIAGSLVAFDLDTAIDFVVDGAGITQVALGVDDDTDVTLVADAVRAAVGDDIEVVSNETVQAETEDDFGEFIDIFGNILLGFAIVTLIVSAFIIYNTFAIVISQRVRELGLLRSLGASGRQITLTILGESVVVGIAATVLGIGAGLGVAAILRAILDALGGGFPGGPLPITTRTVVVAAIMGIGVTVGSSIIPALRARRVSPLAALRDDVRLERSTVTIRPLVGRVLLVLGAVLLVLAVISPNPGPFGLIAAVPLYLGGSRTVPFLGRFSILIVGVALLTVAALRDLDTAPLLISLSVGALLTFVGVNLVSPLFAKPISAVVGTRALGVVLLLLGVLLGAATVGAAVAAVRSVVDGDVGPFVGWVIVAAVAALGARLCLSTWRAPWGAEGRMGTGNAGRNPRRTASTAAALMIGLALVGTVTVIGSSIKATFNEVLDQSVEADWFICVDRCQGQFDGMSPDFAEALAELDEIDSVVPYRFAEEAIKTLVDDEVHDVLTADFPKLDEHLDADFIEGGPDDADINSLLIHEDSAGERDLSVGDSLDIRFATGAETTVTIAGIFSDSRILGNWVISNDAYEQFLPPAQDQFVSVVSAPDVAETDARAAIEAEADRFPDVSVRTKEEFRDLQSSQIDQALVIVNVLLGLSLVIALVGIANTLALSVFERTREIGLLRAVGSTRPQTSMLVRWEGAIIAVFGGILGLVLGIAFGVIAVIVIPDSIVDTIDIPPVQLILYLVIAALAGLIAAYFPARNAARLNVLEAIATE